MTHADAAWWYLAGVWSAGTAYLIGVTIRWIVIKCRVRRLVSRAPDSQIVLWGQLHGVCKRDDESSAEFRERVVTVACGRQREP